MRAMILSAGLGTRLWPLTDAANGIPKPCVPVANRPLAAFAMDALAAHGVSDAIMNAHHHSQKLMPILEPVLPAGIAMQVAFEETLLGTGGGVANMAEQMALQNEEDVIVTNSDIVFAPDLKKAIAHHRASKAYATMVLRRDPNAAVFGPVSIDSLGRVHAILEKPATDSPAPETEDMMFTGVHILSARAARDLPDKGCIVQKGYLRWLAEGRVVSGVVEDSPWRDLGTLSAYLDINVALATGGLRWPGIDPNNARGDSWVDPNARVSAALSQSVVFAGGTLTNGRAKRCIITTDAHVCVR